MSLCIQLLCNQSLATTLTLEVQCLIVDGPPDHLPEFLRHSCHHVTCGQLGLSQHTIPALQHTMWGGQLDSWGEW